jgi:hypothetical protein
MVLVESVQLGHILTLQMEWEFQWTGKCGFWTMRQLMILNVGSLTNLLIVMTNGYESYT